MFLSRPAKKYIRKRRSRESVESPAKFNRRSKFQIEIEQDSGDAIGESDGTIFRILNKLGPQGKFFLTSIDITTLCEPYLLDIFFTNSKSLKFCS